MFNKIIGETVEDVSFDEETLWIVFTNRANLTIYNLWTFLPVRSALVDIKGCELSSVKVSNGEVEFAFSEHFLKVDVSDDGYNGPEALVLTIPGEPIVVWN